MLSDLLEGVKKAEEGIVRLVLENLHIEGINSRHGDSLDSVLHICCQKHYLDVQKHY